MATKQVTGKGTTRQSAADHLLLLMAAGVLLLAGCRIPDRITPSPAQPTPTVHRATVTPTIVPTVTLRPTTTPTLQPTTSTPSPPGPTATATQPSPAPTSPPATSTPTPLPTTEEVAIHTFGADVDLTDPGDTITLTWHWSGGRKATLYHLLPTGQLGEPFWDVGPTGSLRVTISPERRNYDTFALFVYDEDGVAAQETVQIPLRCPDAWFFSPAPDICPAGAPLMTDGAQQPFERGVMLWVQAEDRIYVLFDDEQHPRWSAHEDEWDEGEPSLDPSIQAPPGLQQPVRGFGLIWREQPSVRTRVGWATDQERGYETTVQRTSHVRYPVLYIRALDGGVWELGPNGSAWRYLRPADGG